MAITPSKNVGGTRSYYPRTRANRQFRADSTQNPASVYHILIVYARNDFLDSTCFVGIHQM